MIPAGLSSLRVALRRVAEILAELTGWLLILVMGLLVIDLASRGFGRPVYGVSETAMFVMIAIVYLGLPYAELVRGHVRVEFLLDLMGPKTRRLAECLVYCVGVVTLALTLYAVAINTLGAYRTNQAEAGLVPLLIWPVKAVITLGLALYLVQMIVNLALAVIAPEDLPEGSGEPI